MHSPTYKHGNYTKLMQIMLFTAKKTSKTRKKFDFGMEPKITTLLPTCF